VPDTEHENHPDRPSLETRRVTDPRELRALTHPVRLALLEVLAVEGSLTATKAAELIGESPTTCSFHFRQLAKYGFVEEAGGGTGRNRPWKRVHIGMSFPETGDDPEVAIAAESLTELFIDRALDRFEHWRRVRRSYPAEWQEASEVSELGMYVTPAELRELASEVLAILVRYNERLVDPSLRPPEARLVEVLAVAYPVEFGRPGSPPPDPTGAGGDAGPGGAEGE
jgi:predicted transcriptional regulator